MNNFQLSPTLNKDTVFLVKRSELEGRFDPVMVLYQAKIQNLKYNSKNLGSILKSNPQYGANEVGINRQSCNEIRYIRITDIDNDGLLKNKIGKTANKIEDKYLLNFNDLLLARSGSVGRAYLHKENNHKSIFAGYLIRFVIDELKASPDYIFSYMQLKFYKEWVNAIQRTVAQPNINVEEYKSLQIPIPPKKIQKDIVAKMDAAYISKQQNDEKARQLLDSIDDYLLGELGIKLPEKKENTLQDRIFTRRLSEVSGGRFDPLFCSLNKQDRIGSYKFYKVKEIANIRKGDSITSSDISEGDIPVIAGGQKSPYSHNIANNAGDVVTVSASGAYSGYVWYHENPIFASDCTIISSKRTTDLNNRFLFECLKSEQQNIYNIQQGSGQPHVYPSDIKNIKIPLPPLKKQTEIANHITEIRNQAKQLQQQAKAKLEQAKEEVETMILR